MSLLTNAHNEVRPWGSFEQFTLNEPTTVKIIRVDAHKKLSLQRHALRSEFWRVIEGSGTAHVDENIREIVVDDTVEIPKGSLHRLSGGPMGISVLEIAFGTFDENDIERLEDDYNRV
jgi:mannose-6-phosphate isomerase-like protein (cupin superfamily)